MSLGPFHWTSRYMFKRANDRIPPLVLEAHTNGSGCGLQQCKEDVDAFNRRYSSIVAGSPSSFEALVLANTPPQQDRTGCGPTFADGEDAPTDPVKEYCFPQDRVIPLPQLESDHESLVCHSLCILQSQFHIFQ